MLDEAIKNIEATILSLKKQKAIPMPAQFEKSRIEEITYLAKQLQILQDIKNNKPILPDDVRFLQSVEELKNLPEIINYKNISECVKIIPNQFFGMQSAQKQSTVSPVSSDTSEDDVVIITPSTSYN